MIWSEIIQTILIFELFKQLKDVYEAFQSETAVQEGSKRKTYTKGE